MWYRISTWDHERQCWSCFCRAKSPMRLRRAIRHLRRLYDDVSLLLSCEWPSGDFRQ